MLKNKPELIQIVTIEISFQKMSKNTYLTKILFLTQIYLNYISSGHPVVLAVQNESKAIALRLHYQGTAKVDEDHTGPTKRITYVRDGHESVYDVSENPKSSTML